MSPNEPRYQIPEDLDPPAQYIATISCHVLFSSSVLLHSFHSVTEI